MSSCTSTALDTSHNMTPKTTVNNKPSTDCVPPNISQTASYFELSPEVFNPDSTGRPNKTSSEPGIKSGDLEQQVELSDEISHRKAKDSELAAPRECVGELDAEKSRETTNEISEDSDFLAREDDEPPAGFMSTIVGVLYKG